MTFLGVLIPTLQAAINAKGLSKRRVDELGAQDVALSTANFHLDYGDDLFPAILSNLLLFEDINVDENDRLILRSIGDGISKAIIQSQKTAKKLRMATRDHKGPEVLRGLEDQLNTLGILLNNLQITMMKYSNYPGSCNVSDKGQPSAVTTVCILEQ